MKKNQAGFVPVIIVLVVLIGFVGFYYLRDLGPRAVITDPSYSIATVVSSSKPTVPTTKPTTDPTANWKTFVHKFGYSVKYPQDIKVLAMKNFAEDITPTDEYSDIMFSSQTGFDKPHLRVLRLVKDFSDTKLSNMEIAQKYYQANLDMPGLPATSVQAPKQDTFLDISSVSYALKNKGFKSIVDEYMGYDGIYHVVWLEKDNYKYMIYWTEDKLIDQILATFKFTN